MNIIFIFSLFIQSVSSSLCFIPSHLTTRTIATSTSISSASTTLSSCKKRNRKTQLKSWGIGDDWSALSNAENANNNFDPLDPASYSYEAQRIEGPPMNFTQSPEDAFITDTIDFIYQTNGIEFPSEPVPPLYDTPKSFEKYTKSVAYLDEAGREISMLVHCNESPESLLVEEGRALLPLSDEERMNVTQLLQPMSFSNTTNSSFHTNEQYKTTSFFDQSVSKIFYTHAKPKQISPSMQRAVLDAEGISSWMTACLDEQVGQYSKRVTAVISRYGEYGKGYLESFQFHQLYVDAVMSGVTKRTKRTNKFGGVNSPMNRLNLIQPDLSSVWRDFEAHGIVSPVEQEYKEKEKAINIRIDEYINNEAINMIMDECEIIDWGDNKNQQVNSYKSKSENNNRELSSHEKVELASDGKTPLRLRDGSFVFIDEESCIGCMQCALVAPSSFKMLETGRARTFSQSNNPDVDAAISVCPVGCMHNVGFQELKEMEKARDDGDGRNDHRHMGRNNGHTPLSVAGIDSDANHKSSWYHHLKSKCFTSKSCPQKGCYECPMYKNSGDNPYFKAKHRKDEHIRAQEFIKSGEADRYRNFCDL